MSAVSYPAFYAEVPTIRLRDPLADFLGAAPAGLFEYGYLDAVKLAGHSCPTVASAYGLTRLALRALYGDELPERGGIRVAFADTAASGVTGVIASVVTLLTGAAGEGGFKGLAGRHARRGLLDFAVDLPLAMRFTRLDTGAAVDAVSDPTPVPSAAEMAALIPQCFSPDATPTERAAFGRLWQDRVRRLLLDHGDDPAVFIIRPVP